MAISVFSTDLFSADHTSQYLVPFLKWLLPGTPPATIFAIHDVIRKIAHFVEYFVLSVLVFRGFRAEGRGWRFDWSFWTVALVVAYSALDEVHQRFVPSRTGSVKDVLIDATGATIAQGLVWLYFRFRNQK